VVAGAGVRSGVGLGEPLEADEPPHPAMQTASIPASTTPIPNFIADRTLPLSPKFRHADGWWYLTGMQLDKTIDIKAPRAKVWAALVDIQNWPLWSESMTKIEQLGDGPFGMGSQVRITQPKLPVLVWQVVEFEPGAAFAWQATSRGVTTLASHRVAETADGQSTVTLAIKQTGPLASLAGLALGNVTRRYVEMEANGLKKYCESGT
jgi:uncharacterized protein YndB with AHSA1/START domain